MQRTMTGRRLNTDKSQLVARGTIEIPIELYRQKETYYTVITSKDIPPIKRTTNGEATVHSKIAIITKEEAQYLATIIKPS